MSNFMETYGKALFTLILVAILIAFAGPLGTKIKEYIVAKVSQTEQIGKDEITVATGETVRPDEPIEAVDQIYCIYYNNGELIISQNEIGPDAEKTVIKKGFYNTPRDCTTEMTSVKFKGAVKPKSCSEWFGNNDGGCKNLKEIKNLENLYTTACTNMSYMFSGCDELTSLNLKYFVTTQVTNMSKMFNECRKLKTLNVNKFITDNVENMSDMFVSCTSLKELNVSKFNTEKVRDMSWMFWGCTSLTKIDLSNFKTNNVESMSDMFVNCNSLQELTLSSNFNTEKVTDMTCMFKDCSSLKSLNLISFDIEKVKNMLDMFENCNNLENEGISVSNKTYEKFKITKNLGISIDKFKIVNNL